ncbi:hypothetical protein KAS08_01045 [Candidatus Pacearchaeota archaeon]|nr:hypothetical protein [Candidatus Pacearchaeota archaeon]
MKIKFLQLLIIIVFSFFTIPFIIAQENPDCPIVGGHFENNEIYYECIDKNILTDPGWYKLDENKQFNRLRHEDKFFYTQIWIDKGFNINNKESFIELSGVVLKEFSNKTITLGFSNENSFFKMYNDTFANIIPLETSFIEFDYINEEIINANFIVNKIGGNYTFGNDTFYAPPESRIIFTTEDGVEIKIKDGVDLTGFFSLFNFKGGSPVSIEGKNIEFPDGFNLIEGKVTMGNKGYALDEGNAIYKQNSIQVENDSGTVLIASKNTDLSNYKGNWIRQVDNSLEIQSYEGKKVNIKFLENHDILYIDSSDLMSAQIENGDGLIINERNSLGLIPVINHISSENGKTIIQNGNLEFSLNKNELSMIPLKSSEYKNVLNNKSVAFDIESDSLNMDTKLRINNEGQFDILSKDDESLVTWNKYSLPVSAKLIDNKLQRDEVAEDNAIFESKDTTEHPRLKKGKILPFNVKVDIDLLELASWGDNDRINIGGNSYFAETDDKRRLLIDVGKGSDIDFQHIILDKFIMEYVVIEDNGKGYYLRNLDTSASTSRDDRVNWKVEFKLEEVMLLPNNYRLYENKESGGVFSGFELNAVDDNPIIIESSSNNKERLLLRNSVVNLKQEPDKSSFLYSRDLSSYFGACYSIEEDYKTLTIGKGDFCDEVLKKKLDFESYAKYENCVNNINMYKKLYEYNDEFCVWKELRNTYKKICPSLNEKDITNIFRKKEDYRKMSDSLIHINPEEDSCVPIIYDCTSILYYSLSIPPEASGYSYGSDSPIYMNPYIFDGSRDKDNFYFILLHEGYHGLQSGEAKIEGDYNFGDERTSSYLLTNVEIDPRVSLIQLWWLEKTCSEADDKDIILSDGIIDNEDEARVVLDEFYHYPRNDFISKFKNYYVYTMLQSAYIDYTRLNEKDWEGFRDEILVKRLPGIAYGKTINELSSSTFAYV